MKRLEDVPSNHLTQTIKERDPDANALEAKTLWQASDLSIDDFYLQFSREVSDGFLRVNDIYNLKLPAELVVLSACQTGLGQEVRGEGLMGLTRAFLYAGAARVVVSLWSVNDRATADLMAGLYRRMLRDGHRPSAALREAQLEMRKQKRWQSPYYWAAFVQMGEWR